MQEMPKKIVALQYEEQEGHHHSSESKMVHQLRDQEHEARGSSPIEMRFFEK